MTVSTTLPYHRITSGPKIEWRCGSQALVYDSPGAKPMLATCTEDIVGHDPEFHSMRLGGHMGGVEFHFLIRWRDDR